MTRFIAWLKGGTLPFDGAERMTWAFARKIGIGRWLVLLLLTAPVGVLAVATRDRPGH